MKKSLLKLNLVIVLFFALLTPKALFAQELSTNEKTLYQQGLSEYKQKQYKQSYEIFSKLVQNNYGSLEYNYYLARSAYFIGETNEAIAAYERILIIQPDNNRTKLELGRIYAEKGQTTLAEYYLNQVLLSNAPQSVKDNIRYYLAQMQLSEEQRYSSNSGFIWAGMVYDSNINNSPINDEFFPGDSIIPFKTDKDIGNWTAQQMVFLSNRYQNPKTMGYAIKNDFLVYNKSIPGESDYNLLYLKYKPGIEFKSSENGLWNISAVLDHMKYGPDAYLNTYGISPKYIYMPTLTHYLSIELTGLQKIYQREIDNGRDAKFGEANILFQQTIGPQLSYYLQGLVQFERRDKSTTTNNVDYNAFDARAGINYKLLNGFNLGASLGFKQTDYQTEDSIFDTYRSDTKFYPSITVSKDIFKDIAVAVRVQRINNSSNAEAYDYEKNLFGISITKRF